MTGRARAAGEGSIFPYRNGYAAYSWVRTPSGQRTKKWVYGKTRDLVHDKWIALQHQARDTPVPNRVPRLGEHLQYWLAEIVRPNLAPLTYQTYETFVRLYIEPHLGGKRLDRLQIRDVQAWTTDEARRFLKSARTDHDPLYAAYVLILVLGLRTGEVLGLEWMHVDLGNAELRIALQLQRVSRELLHRETKTEGSEASLPSPASA